MNPLNLRNWIALLMFLSVAACDKSRNRGDPRIGESANWIYRTGLDDTVSFSLIVRGKVVYSTSDTKINSKLKSELRRPTMPGGHYNGNGSGIRSMVTCKIDTTNGNSILGTGELLAFSDRIHFAMDFEEEGGTGASSTAINLSDVLNVTELSMLREGVGFDPAQLKKWHPPK
jgi:hypothetical protein